MTRKLGNINPAGFNNLGLEPIACVNGDKIVLTDAKGGKSTVTSADMVASNGTVHMVDTVVMP